MGDKPRRCVMYPKKRAAPSPAVRVRIRSVPCMLPCQCVPIRPHRSTDSSAAPTCLRSDARLARVRSMKKLATLVIVSIAFSVSASGQATRGRALTIEDYYRIKTVGDPQISQNGQWVTYTVTTRAEDDNTNAIETFVVPADGSAPPRRITHDGRSVASPRWNDDGLLQYTLNARTNSAVFVGGDQPRTKPEPAARFAIAVDRANATPVPATEQRSEER